MDIYIPTHLRSYTHQEIVQAGGATVGDVLAELNERYPGFRFRIVDEQDAIREHIKIFVNQELANNLRHPLRAGDRLRIIAALSGGCK